MLYLAPKSDMSFWDGALSPLILTLSWKQTFHVCKENEEEEEEDEGSPDFQDVACILSCMMAAAQDYRVWGGYFVLFYFGFSFTYSTQLRRVQACNLRDNMYQKWHGKRWEATKREKGVEGKTCCIIQFFAFKKSTFANMKSHRLLVVIFLMHHCCSFTSEFSSFQRKPMQ